MKNLKFICCLMFLGCFFSKNINAQIFVEGLGGAQELNLCTCELDSALPNSASSALAASATNLYITIDYDFFIYDFNNQVPVLVSLLPGEPVGLVYGPDNLLYANAFVGGAQNDTLISIDPVTGIATVLGAFPSGWWLAGDLFFYGGQLYGWFGVGTSTILAQISTADPQNSTVLFTYTAWYTQIAAGVVWVNGVETVLVFGEENGQAGVYSLNMTTGDYQLICPGVTISDMAIAPNYEVSACC
jgi:hypothetical protein